MMLCTLTCVNDATEKLLRYLRANLSIYFRIHPIFDSTARNFSSLANNTSRVKNTERAAVRRNHPQAIRNIGGSSWSSSSATA